jgi:hypothetical protein
MPINGAARHTGGKPAIMVEAVSFKPPYKPPPKTHVVLLAQTRGQRFNCYHNSTLIVSETTQPIADSARALLLNGCSPEDRVVIRLTGATGDQHEALVKRLGDIA